MQETWFAELRLRGFGKTTVTIARDYGTYVQNGGAGGIPHTFYDFRTDHIAIVGPLQFSIMSVFDVGGVDYAMSLDIDSDRLSQLLDVTPDFVTLIVADEMKRDPLTPRAIELPMEITFGVTAWLGTVQNAKKEEFIPFLAERIFRVGCLPPVRPDPH